MIPRKRKHPKKSLVEESAEKAVARLGKSRRATDPAKYPIAIGFDWVDYPRGKRPL